MWLVNAPRWLLLAALAYAPWAYGCTRPWTVQLLNTCLAIACGLWLITCLLRRAWPAVHPVAAASGLALILQAWFMIGNARFEYDTQQHQFIPLTPLLPWAAGSLHRALSLENTLQLCAILGAFGLACEMARHPQWRKRLLLTMAVTGTSIAALGLLQRLTNASAVFWGPEDMGKTFFATYRNHTNAGAFLNVAWPLVAGFVAIACIKSTAPWRRGAWTGALVLCLAAIFVNSSRAAAALGLLLALAWAAWAGWQIFRGRLPAARPAVALVTALILLGLVASVAAVAGLDTSLRRWKKFSVEVTDQNPRLLAAEVCTDMVPQAGWMGFGPGTFQTTFPYFTHRFGNQLRGRWLYAHQDYLQTIIEWGYVGASLWGVLIFGAIGYSMCRALRDRSGPSRSARVTHFAILLALLGVLLHALVDFPLQIPSIQLYVAVLLGLLWASRHWLRAARHPHRHSRSHPHSRAPRPRDGAPEPAFSAQDSSATVPQVER